MVQPPTRYWNNKSSWLGLLGGNKKQRLPWSAMFLSTAEKERVYDKVSQRFPQLKSCVYVQLRKFSQHIDLWGVPATHLSKLTASFAPKFQADPASISFIQIWGRRPTVRIPNDPTMEGWMNLYTSRGVFGSSKWCHAFESFRTGFLLYTLEDQHGTYKSTIWKGKWSSKPPWLFMFHVTLQGCKFFSPQKTPQVFLTLHFHLGTSRIDAAERSSRSRVPSAAAANTTTPRGGVGEMGGQGKKACVCVCFFFFFLGGGGGGLNSLVFGEGFWLCYFGIDAYLTLFACFFLVMEFYDDNYWYILIWLMAGFFFALRLVTPNAHCLGGFIVRSVMDLLVLGAVNFCLPFIMVLFRWSLWQILWKIY